MSVKIMSHVVETGPSLENPGMSSFRVQASTSEPLFGFAAGQFLFDLDAQLTDIQLQTALRMEVAHQVNAQIGEPGRFTAADVRGCTF